VEEVFYLVLPISLIFFYKKRKVLWGIVGMIALSTIWRKFGTMPNIVEAFPFIKYHMWSTLGRFDALLYGVLGAYLHRADKYKLFFAKINPFFLILVLYFLNNYNVPFKPTFEAITFALIVLSCTSKDSGLLVTFLENPVFKFLGKISYSYYVFQQIALLKMDLAPAWLKALTGEYYSVFFALTFALISYYLIENPMRKIGIEISNRQIATKKV
jgi:peptidoglycan/LPS O-acetylase OafA/YrhL